MSHPPQRKKETVDKEMTGDEAIAFVFHELKVSKVFLSPGVPDFLKVRLKEYKIQSVEAFSPRGAIALADSFARATNELGVAIITPGSRVLDGLDVIAQAYSDSVPLMIVATLRSYRDTGRARIGELRSPDDVYSAVSPFVKSRERIVTIEETTEVLERAWKDALSNRPRPVYVEIAEDLFRLKAYPLASVPQKVEKRTPDKATAAKVAELLVNSKRPVIVAGYGVLSARAWDSLRELAEILDIPVITTIRGKGALPSSHPLFAGEGLGLFATESATHFLDNADVILALGTRFTQASTGGWSFKFRGYVVHNNIEGEDISKVFVPQVPAVADADLFLKEVIANVKSKVKEPVDRGSKGEVFAYKKSPKAEPHSGLWPIDVVYALLDAGYSTVFVDLDSTTYDFIRLPIERPFQWITSETAFVKSIAIGGIVNSSDPKAVGITTLEGVMRNGELLVYALKHGKGKVLVMNDGGATYLDTYKSDVPSIGRGGNVDYHEEYLEKSFGAITVRSFGELVSVLNESVDGVKVINVELDPDFKSVVLP